MAVFSCANLPFGYFNAYAHAAARDDMHLGLHLGDYLYEYKRGTYPSERDAVAARVLEPANELIHLADYRMRYACYRADPDLQALHSRLAIIPSVDDHETANDSWEGGAENHNPGEGDYTERKIAAMQAWREWMPVSDEPYATYEFGDLGTYFRTETRTIGRSQAPSLEAALKGAADPVAALKAFRDGDWADSARSMMGSTQEHWLADGLHRSVRSRKRWQVVGVGTIVGRQVAPPEAANWISPDAPDYITTRVKAALLAAKLGLPSDLESWGGFPAARARLLQSAQSADADLVILAGDSHNAWGFELSQDGKRAAVEFDGHSVTSPGYESFFRQVPPTDISSALVRANPELKWCSTAGRGYMTVTLTPEAASSEWLFMDTVIGRSTQVGRTHRMHTRAGRRMLEAA
jgi:alkaline phosphatase D